MYSKYRDSGWSNLPQPQGDVSVPEDIAQVLESVWATYGEQGGNELEALSHIELPWRNARIGAKEDERSTNVIDPDDMKRFYRSIYEGDDK